MKHHKARHHHAHAVHHKKYHPPKALKKFGQSIAHAAHVVEKKVFKPIGKATIKAAPKVAHQVEESLTAPFTTPWEVTRDVVHTTGGVITHTEDAIQGTVKSVFQSPTTMILLGLGLVVLLRR